MLGWLRQFFGGSPRGAGASAGVGRRGEREAANYLRKKGLRILARNVREGHGEIDLVAEEGSTLVFVEVKSRTVGSREEMTGLEKLDRRKLEALRRACGLYRKRARHTIESYRLDAVTVELDASGRRPKVREVRWHVGVADLDNLG